MEWATLEPSGKLGIILKQEAEPTTKKDIQQLQASINTLMTNQSQLEQLTKQFNKTNTDFSKDNIFTEVRDNEHKNPPPKHLQ